MGATKIDWADTVWNPVTGCTKISAGCKFCYAERMAKRLKAMGQEKYRSGFDVTTHPETLSEPLGWRKPKKVFVCSMGDLFHDRVPDDFIAAVFGVMASCPQHTFMVLTKRPERARRWFEWVTPNELQIILDHVSEYLLRAGLPITAKAHLALDFGKVWPLPNCWLGVSVENQAAADERIPELLKVPAAVHFVSLEPLLESVRLKRRWLESGGAMAKDGGRSTLSWVVAGCESGPKARPFDEEWARSLRDQCVEAGVAYYYKQKPGPNGRGVVHTPKLDGRQWTQFPEACSG